MYTLADSQKGSMGGISLHSLALVGISHPSSSVPCAVSALRDEEARTGLSDCSAGRPADGGIQHLILFHAEDCGEHSDEDAIKLGENMTVREDKPVQYGVLRVTFVLSLATGGFSARLLVS